jgi:hypothetical protein
MDKNVQFHFSGCSPDSNVANDGDGPQLSSQRADISADVGSKKPNIYFKLL